MGFWQKVNDQPCFSEVLITLLVFNTLIRKETKNIRNGYDFFDSKQTFQI